METRDAPPGRQSTGSAAALVPPGQAKKAAKAAAAAAMKLETAKAVEIAESAPHHFACVAKQQLPGISAVEALQWGGGASGGSTPGGGGGGDAGSTGESLTLAAGFKETEFVVHSLVNQCELLRVTCGGWHRPRSLLLDDVRRGGGEGGFTFAFCKGGELTVLRRAPSASGGGEGGGGAEGGGPNWNMRMLNVWSHGCVCCVVLTVELDSMYKVPSHFFSGGHSPGVFVS